MKSHYIREGESDRFFMKGVGNRIERREVEFFHLYENSFLPKTCSLERNDVQESKKEETKKEESKKDDKI